MRFLQLWCSGSRCSLSHQSAEVEMSVTKLQWPWQHSTILETTLFMYTKQTQNICITFVECWTNVEDVGGTLWKFYTNVLYLLQGSTPPFHNINSDNDLNILFVLPFFADLFIWKKATFHIFSCTLCYGYQPHTVAKFRANWFKIHSVN